MDRVERCDQGLCSRPDCEEPVVTRKMCARHYVAWRKNGGRHTEKVEKVGDRWCANEVCNHLAQDDNEYCPFCEQKVRMNIPLDYFPGIYRS